MIDLRLPKTSLFNESKSEIFLEKCKHIEAELSEEAVRNIQKIIQETDDENSCILKVKKVVCKDIDNEITKKCQVYLEYCLNLEIKRHRTIVMEDEELFEIYFATYVRVMVDFIWTLIVGELQLKTHNNLRIDVNLFQNLVDFTNAMDNERDNNLPMYVGTEKQLKELEYQLSFYFAHDLCEKFFKPHWDKKILRFKENVVGKKEGIKYFYVLLKKFKNLKIEEFEDDNLLTDLQKKMKENLIIANEMRTLSRFAGIRINERFDVIWQKNIGDLKKTSRDEISILFLIFLVMDLAPAIGCSYGNITSYESKNNIELYYHIACLGLELDSINFWEDDISYLLFRYYEKNIKEILKEKHIEKIFRRYVEDSYNEIQEDENKKVSEFVNGFNRIKKINNNYVVVLFLEMWAGAFELNDESAMYAARMMNKTCTDILNSFDIKFISDKISRMTFGEKMEWRNGKEVLILEKVPPKLINRMLRKKYIKVTLDLIEYICE